MPDWTQVDWGALFAHPANDTGPWVALAVIVGVVAIGFVEMRFSKSRKIGLTTWGFGIPPFIAAIYWIATWAEMPIVVRALLSGVLFFSTWKGLSSLYRYAERFEARSQQGNLP